MRCAFLCLALAGAVLGAQAASVDAATRCSLKTANGTGPSEKVAKFEVYEGMLKSVDWSIWAQWLADGTTPGYRVGKPVYVCRTGVGLGVSCRGQAKICRL